MSKAKQAQKERCKRGDHKLEITHGFLGRFGRGVHVVCLGCGKVPISLDDEKLNWTIGGTLTNRKVITLMEQRIKNG